uniref:Peptidyl-prolyl cis-trans isomerase n=1 Tax=Amphilophus citrinellus TaxID=61819 RepID=A0A3Q0T3H1_AMPCI
MKKKKKKRVAYLSIYILYSYGPPAHRRDFIGNERYNGEVSVPVTIPLFSPAENVRALSAGERGFGHKEPVFFRVILQFLCQEGFLVINYFPCGDKSICGRSFPDENFKLKHTGPGDYPHLLQMRVKAMWYGSLTHNTSSFRLNGKHVVFGRVKEGMDVAKKMECFFVHRIGTHQRSSHITDCVELKQIYSLIAEPK